MQTSIDYPAGRARNVAAIVGHMTRQWSGRVLDKLVRLSALGMIEASACPECDAEATPAADRDARLLRQAVYLNSAVDLDWLCYAGMMADPARSRFCLERALALDPTSEQALNALGKFDLADRASSW